MALLRRVLLVLASLAVAVLPDGCSQKAPSWVVFVLFDISGSTSAPEIRQRYFRDFQKILEAMQGGGLLMCDVITENTLATSNPIEAFFPAYNPLIDNPLSHKKKLQKITEQMLVEAKKLILETPPAPMTDLMNSFQLASKIFNGERCKGAGGKALVVFSDMIEQSRNYDFQKLRLTEERTQQIIETERRDGRLPNLSGVKVWVSGATAAKKGGVSPKKIYQIQNFWLHYFQACGADLTSERYATTLINFELPPIPGQNAGGK
jgi:hypothetical protein